MNTLKELENKTSTKEGRNSNSFVSKLVRGLIDRKHTQTL